MGMDVYGKDPTDPKGEYFRASVWVWHPLAKLLEVAAPDLTVDIEHLHTNDGSGLGALDSIRLADNLDDKLHRGWVAEYIRQCDEELAALPLLDCRWCDATGTRTDQVGRDMGMDKRHWCNGCAGTGQVKDDRTMYGLDEADVKEFAEFVRYSGGFEIC